MEKDVRVEVQARSRHLVAMSGVVLGAAYCLWRIGGLPHADALWLSVPLAAAEILLLVIYALDVWVAWPAQLGPRAGVHPEGDVAILVTTFNESEVAVRTSLLACLEIPEVTSIHLLDDGDRDDLRHLATRYGARYITRASPTGGRSGAIAHGLTVIDEAFVLVLAGDETPRPDSIRRALPYLEDDVAAVQLGRDYANVDSVIHSSRTRHDESWQYDVVEPAADARGAASWSGSGALVRTAAVEAAGGYPTDSHAAELVMTSRLQAAGWRIRYLNEPLITGLAPHNLPSFIVQRQGLARGQLQVLASRDSALITRGLTRSQRLHQLHLGVSHLGAISYLVVGVCLLIALTQGIPPFAATPLGVSLLAGWIASMSLGRLAAGHGCLTLGSTVTRNLVSIELRLRAVWKTLRRDRRRAGVPAGDPENEDVVHHLPALLGFVIALEVLLGLRLVDAVLGWPLQSLGGWDLLLVLGWGFSTAWVSLRVVGAFVRRRQERAHHRVGVDYFGSIDGRAAWVVDLSAGGAGVITTGSVAIEDEVTLGVDLSYTSIAVRGVVRSSLPNQDGSRVRLGLQLTEVDEDALDEILRCVSLGATTLREGDRPTSFTLAEGDVVDLTIEGSDLTAASTRINRIVAGPTGRLEIMATSEEQSTQV